MNKEVVEKWVTALRSRNFKQTTGRLAIKSGDETAYCCLGVLCEIYEEEVGGLEISSQGNFLKYDHSTSTLPWKVTNWLASGDSDPEISNDTVFWLQQNTDHEVRTLAELNDDGADFELVADVLERMLNE